MEPHITFQDEDNNYEYIYGDFVQLSAFWHQYHVNLVVPYKLRGHNVVTNIMVGGYAGVYYFDEFQVRGGAILRNSAQFCAITAQLLRNYCAIC